MQNIVKYLGIGLLTLGLVACDQKKEEATASKTDNNATSQSRVITLLEGKLSFSLPEGMSDKSDKLGAQSATNMHAYADNTGERAIIVIVGAPNSEKLDVLAQRLMEQQRKRDPQLQVVSDKAITIDHQQAQRLDSMITTHGQSSWSTVVVTKVAERLTTLQISLPADNQQQAQTDADAIVKTIRLK